MAPSGTGTGRKNSTATAAAPTAFPGRVTDADIMRNIRQQQQVLAELVLLRMLHVTVLAEREQLSPNDHLAVILDAIDRLYRGVVPGQFVGAVDGPDGLC